jgi:oxepin-CoA hydrolase/3-oxo-5,6-dehydrosuberyl-CoA semialdehyde dehydrogenase
MTKETLLQRLDQLNSDSKAKFGIFTPQHMVEHLTISLKLSVGKIHIPVFEPNEKQLARKQALLFTDIPFPQGVKAPGSRNCKSSLDRWLGCLPALI